MNIAGFLLLPAGWIIVLAAIVLLRSAPSRAVFVLAGVAIEVLGLAFAIRSHLVAREVRR